MSYSGFSGLSFAYTRIDSTSLQYCRGFSPFFQYSIRKFYFYFHFFIFFSFFFAIDEDISDKIDFFRRPHYLLLRIQKSVLNGQYTAIITYELSIGFNPTLSVENYFHGFKKVFESLSIGSS